MTPLVGVSSPAIMRRVVVLPAARGPEEAHEAALWDDKVEVLDGLRARARIDFLDTNQLDPRHKLSIPEL